MYVYAFTQLLNGIFVDRYGGYRVMLVGAFILGLGCIIFPLSSTLSVMYLSRALLGLGGSMFYLSLIKELGQLFEESKHHRKGNERRQSVGDRLCDFDTRDLQKGGKDDAERNKE